MNILSKFNNFIFLTCEINHLSKNLKILIKQDQFNHKNFENKLLLKEKYVLYPRGYVKKPY